MNYAQQAAMATQAAPASTVEQIRSRIQTITNSLDTAASKLADQLDRLLGSIPRGVDMMQVPTTMTLAQSQSGIFGDLQRLDDLTQSLHRELDRLS
jgi:hypothetical protein